MLKILCSRQVQGPGSSAQPADPLQGQVTTELIQRMRQSISDALDTQTVEVVDVSGDGRHVGIDVVAQAFEVRPRKPFSTWLWLHACPHVLCSLVCLTGQYMYRVFRASSGNASYTKLSGKSSWRQSMLLML